jgi:hypothetical protein
MTVATLKEVSAKLGVTEEKIKTYRHAYVGMAAQMGVFTKKHVGRYRGMTALTDDDLGIKLTEQEKKWVKLGNQLLLPPDTLKKLDHVEGQGRSNVDKHALVLLMGSWIPVTAWDSFKKGDEALKKEFFEIRDEIVRDYPSLMAQVKKAVMERAREVYERLPNKPAVREVWLNAFVQRVVSRADTAEQIYASFTWETELEWLPAPSSIEGEEVKLKQLQVERQKVQAEQARLSQDERVAWAQEQDRFKKIEEINKEFMEQERKKREEAAKTRDAFVADVMKQLREALYNSARQVLVTMKRNDGGLVGASVNSLQSMVDRGRMLNFMNDGEVEAFYSEIEKHLKKTPDRRRPRDIQSLMEKIQAEMGQSVRAIESDKTREEEVCRIIAKGVQKDARTIE